MNFDVAIPLFQLTSGGRITAEVSVGSDVWGRKSCRTGPTAQEIRGVLAFLDWVASSDDRGRRKRLYSD